MNMTSVDSGVETGNDSNDSSIIQHENQHTTTATADQIAGNSITTVANTNQVDKQQEPGSSIICIDFRPVWSGNLHFHSPSLCPVIENYSFSEKPESSSTTHVSSISPWLSKLLRTAYGANRAAIGATTVEVLRDKSGYRNKTRQRRNIGWRDWQIPHIERKMRLAAATNNTMYMKMILNSGISPNNHDEHGRTPLHHAACRGYTEMVRLLLDNGADPNQRDCIGNTPLHLAAVTSKISVVTMLLSAGTDVLSLDQHGYNPLQLAQTKLRMLQNYDDADMANVKKEMHNIVSMLLAYLQKQKNMREQVETLSNFCSRLSLSNTSNQVQDDVKDLLANIETLSITS